jgi:hypothetical protein
VLVWLPVGPVAFVWFRPLSSGSACGQTLLCLDLLLFQGMPAAMLRLTRNALVASLLAAPALAQSVTDQMVAALRDQGYDILEMHDTWLGRVRVIAETETIRREIVFNPGTGEILRDYAVDLIALAAREAADAAVRHGDDDTILTTTMQGDDMRGEEGSFAADTVVLPEAIVTTPEQ